MNYSLINSKTINTINIRNIYDTIKPYIFLEKTKLLIGFGIIIINSIASIVSPYIISFSIDNYIANKNISGLMYIIYALFLLYLLLTGLGYLQTRIMSLISQRLLFRIRNNLFNKIQTLPIEFFNQNKTGDLMSRIIGDIDRLNQLLSETVARFIGSVFVIIGIGIFICFLNFKLALVGLSSCLIIYIITKLIGNYTAKLNVLNLKNLGELSAITEQNLTNYKVIIAFNRKDYFKNIFENYNQKSFKSGIKAGIGNEFYKSIYDLSGNLAQVGILFYGLYLVSVGEITLGLLIGFVLYIQKFYEPLRIIGSLWGTIKQSNASWLRINQILCLENNLTIINDVKKQNQSNKILVFENVYFGYNENEYVLKNVCLQFEKGKTYALIGPTGGGKSTTASLMLRLYDPTKGTIYFDNNNIKTFSPDQISRNIGFIQQDPFIFQGTIGENIKYGNDNIINLTNSELLQQISEIGLNDILDKFDEGLDTKTMINGDNLSLGQKQLISFMRTILRKPKLLILDEATANIDTITEQLLTKIIDKLPVSTTKVIIAHRLNTIKKADEIIFINEGKYTKAINFDDAIDLIKTANTKT